MTFCSSFQCFAAWLEGRPHGSVHMFVYGSMSDMFSPDDPLFWLHHCNIDRLYRFWADCWDYESIITLTTSTTSQYKSCNPISGKWAAFNPYTGTKYDTGLSAKIPYYVVGPSTSSYPIPSTNFPTPKQLWSMGESGTPGFDGIFYRYGPDVMAVSELAKSCRSKQWKWVNQPYSSLKRSLEDFDDHPQLPRLREQERIFREEIAKGRSHAEVLHDLATANCHTAHKLDENDPRLLDWIRMNKQELSDWDSPCDKISDRLNKGTESSDQTTTELSAGGSFVPLWVIISASVGTAIILITIIVLIIIYLRKKAQGTNSEYSYAEMKE